MTYNEDRVKRIASFITITADLFDGKPEYTRNAPPKPDGKGGYIYDPEHKLSKAEVQRKIDGPIHETPKGWAEGAEQMDMFRNAPATSNENKDLFGTPVPSDKAMFPLQTPVEPPKQEPPKSKPDLKGQQTMPIVDPIVEQPSLPETKKQESPKPATTQADGFKTAVSTIRQQFKSPHVFKMLSTIPKGMLSIVGQSIKKFDHKGLDTEMTVTNPTGVSHRLVVKQDSAPINETDGNMQALHAVGAAWAVSSGLADDEQFQTDAKKAMTKDLDNFVSRYTDLPIPGEEYKTMSPANWIAKGYSTPRAKAAFYKLFAKGLPDSGDKASLMVRSFIGAMQVASDGEYGHGTPQQPDNDTATKVANMAGYVAQGFANDNGFMKKNMPLTTKLFTDKMM